MDRKEALNRIIFLLEELEDNRNRLSSVSEAAMDIEIALLNQQVLSLYKQIQNFHTAKTAAMPQQEPPKQEKRSFRVEIETPDQRREPAPAIPANNPDLRLQKAALEVIELPNEVETKAQQGKPEDKKPIEPVVTPVTEKVQPVIEKLPVETPEPPREQPKPQPVQEPVIIPEVVKPVESKPEPVSAPIKEEPVAPTPMWSAAAETEHKPERQDISALYAKAREQAALHVTETPKAAEPIQKVPEAKPEPVTAPEPPKPQPAPVPEPPKVHYEPEPVAPIVQEQPKPQPEPVQPPQPVQSAPAPEPEVQKPQPVQPPHQGVSLGERLAGQHVKKNLADKLKLSPISDLRTAIGINQKIAIIKHLFRGDEKEFKKTISFINDSSNFSEAKMYLQSQVIPVYQWDDENQLVQDFMELVYRKFL